MANHQLISFGDKVRVRSTPITDQRELAGLTGQVYGETTPSVTGVEVIGEASEDFAVNVFFETLDEAYWFATDLLEFVDHAPGTEMRLEGVAKKWVRSESGEWMEESTTEVHCSAISSRAKQKREPWWRFW